MTQQEKENEILYLEIEGENENILIRRDKCLQSCFPK